MKEKAAIQGPVDVVGTMSGTSLDGVDAAMLRTDGVTIAGFGPTAYRPYTEDERAVLRAALGAWPEDPAAMAAAEIVERAHLDVLSDFAGAKLIGFHGQTLAHEPGRRGTHQVGSGVHLAAATDCAVAWDFRSADVAAGGQGAPLAPVFHFALARRLGKGAPLAFLNLGGVGNLTWLDPSADDPFAPGALVAFDTGPANAPLDDLVRIRRGGVCDSGGALAAEGSARPEALAAFLADPYFDLPPPKSLDRDAFGALAQTVAPLDDADAAATLVEAVALSVARGLRGCPAPPVRLLITGGGRHNPVMMARIAALAGCPVAPVEAVGFDGDMIEAQAFGYLAVRVLRGLPITGPGTTGVSRPLTGGRLSRPPCAIAAAR